MKKPFVVFGILSVLALVMAVLVLPVSATQTFRWLHHEAQGNHDQTWTKCMPESAWNGHKNHEGDWLGGVCGEPEPTGVPPTEPGSTEVPPTGVPPTEPGSTEVYLPPATPTPVPACMIDIQVYAVISDLPANVAYLAVAYNMKPPDLINQADEGEVANLYVVNNGGVKAIKPNGHQAAFLALDVTGYAEVDGNAYVRGCSGSVFINMYDNAGNFLGHPALRWDGGIAKGFHSVNSGYQDELSFLDLGVMPK